MEYKYGIPNSKIIFKLMNFQMVGFAISGTVTHRISKRQVVLVSQTVAVCGGLKFPKHKNSSVNLFSIENAFYHHYKNMICGKAANTSGRKICSLKLKKKKLLKDFESLSAALHHPTCLRSLIS